MRKTISIAAVLAIVSGFAFAGCQTAPASAPKPAEHASETTTVPVKPAPGC
jgi:hypothetical protein